VLQEEIPIKGKNESGEQMQANDVLELLKLLEQHGIGVVVDGGGR
jgi:hypothetical protein